MRIAARVDWYDSESGFGLVFTDDGDSAFLTRATLRHRGLAISTEEDATLECALVPKGKGLEVDWIYTMQPPPPKEPLPRRSPPLEKRHVVARVSWFDAQRGYGMVWDREVIGDILVHRTCLATSGYEQLMQGEIVEGLAELRHRGWYLTEIERVVDRAPGSIENPSLMHDRDARLLWIDAALGVAAVGLPEVNEYGVVWWESVALCPPALVRSVGAIDPATAPPLICDVELVGRLYLIRRLTQA